MRFNPLDGVGLILTVSLSFIHNHVVVFGRLRNNDYKTLNYISGCDRTYGSVCSATARFERNQDTSEYKRGGPCLRDILSNTVQQP